jgi:hypothetical protein
MGVCVAVGVELGVGDNVPVAVVVSVCVGVGVDVDPAGEVDVGEARKAGVSVVAVDGGGFVGFGLRVDVEVTGINTNVLVGLAGTITVLVAEETVVGAGEGVDVMGGNGVRVIIDTPGVRKLTQPGGVRMAASTGSINSPGSRVRNVLFGSI